MRLTSRNNLHGKVVALIQQGMEEPEDRDVRLKILNKLIGREISTSRKLTQWECQTMITSLKDNNDDKWSITERGAKLIYDQQSEKRNRLFRIGEMMMKMGREYSKETYEMIREMALEELESEVDRKISRGSSHRYRACWSTSG